MGNKVKTTPDGYRTVTAHLIVKDIAKALEFYTRALGATERFRMTCPDTGVVRHAEIQIGDSIVMLGTECEQAKTKSPLALGGTASSLYLYVADVDAAFAKATKAGGKTLQPVMNMFWGDRYGKILDPFGHEWSLATHQEDLSPEAIAERAKEFFAAAANAH